MYSSSNDSESDSGANFKRGKRKIKSESPVRPTRKTTRKTSPEKSSSRFRKDDEDRFKRHEARRRDDNSRAHKTENGERKARKSPKLERVRSKERPKENANRPKSRERIDNHRSRSKSPERFRKKRSRSTERDSHHHHHNRGSAQGERKEPKEFKRDDVRKIRDVPTHSVDPPKHLHRSKSPSKHSKDDRRHSSSRKKSCSRDRHHSQSRNEDKSSKSIESKKPSRHSSQDERAYGPALPPPIVKRNNEDDNKQALPRSTIRKADSPVVCKPKIGPSMPKDFRRSTDNSRVENYDVISSSDEDDNMVIGPLPASAEMSERDLELEKRKIEIKLQQLDRRMMAMTSNSDVKNREEWMLELPEIRKVADMGLSSRQFRKNDRPDFSDRSSWTKTPNDQHKKPKHDKKSDEDKRRELETRRRDEQQEKLAKDHKKIHKRDKSLLEIHEKKLKKEKKNQKEEKKERRPFNRDSDLSANKFDEARKKSVLKKAQLLDTRFSKGSKKYL